VQYAAGTKFSNGLKPIGATALVVVDMAARAT